MANYLVAYDLGTSGVKATLFSETGALLNSSTCLYEVYYLNGNWTEEQPHEWWEAVRKASQDILTDIHTADIAAVALSGQMSGALLLDRELQPVRPHILWSDGRAWEEGDYIKSIVDPQDHFNKAGKSPGPSRMLEKLLWVQRHEPEAYGRTAKVVQAKDYIAYMLTGNLYTDYSDASQSYLFDRDKKVFSEELLALGNIDPSLMPEAVPSTKVIGTVTRSAAAHTGLMEGTPVVIGAGDVAASTVGARCIGENEMHFCIGSSAWCAVTMERPIPNYKKCYSTLHAVDGLFINQCTLASAGISYKWLKNLLYEEWDKLSVKSHTSAYDLMNALADCVPAGSNGVMYLPYLLGDQSLYNNPNATGAFLGLCAESSRPEMIRAALEGVCYYLTAAAQLQTEDHPLASPPLLIGGAAKGHLWSQLLSDMLGTPCLVAQNAEETTSIGAAIIGGVGVGLFPDFSVVKDFVKVESEKLPNMENHEKYARLRQTFLDVYYGLEPYFMRLKG